MKRIISMLGLCAILCFTMSITAKASDNARWVKGTGDQWVLQEEDGTDLQMRIKDNVMYISGTGAIPTYSRECLGNRPWHGKTVYEIQIERGITSIGAEAFSNMADVYKLDMYASTFVEDASAFAGWKSDATITFAGTGQSTRYIGNLPYTSLDSIVAVMQKYNGKYTFRLANYYIINMAQYGTHPKIVNVVPMDAVNQDYDLNYPFINCDSKITFISGNSNYGSNMTIQYRRQGMAALEAFAAFMGENKWVATYNVSAQYGNQVAKGKIASPIQCALTIPAAYRYPGRQFTLLQIQPGLVQVLQDEDTSDDTVTFTTDYPNTVYALIYAE